MFCGSEFLMDYLHDVGYSWDSIDKLMLDEKSWRAGVYRIETALQEVTLLEARRVVARSVTDWSDYQI